VKWGRKSHGKAGAGGAESIREGLDYAGSKEKERDTRGEEVGEDDRPQKSRMCDYSSIYCGREA
jgi:hypothetical protein